MRQCDSRKSLFPVYPQPSHAVSYVLFRAYAYHIFVFFFDEFRNSGKGQIAAPFRISLEIFHCFIHAEWEGLLSAAQFGLLLRGVDPNDPVTTYHSQVMLSIILSRVKEQDCDKDWFKLATNHLGISRHDLNHYLTCGDSLLLANCIAFLWNIISDFFWIPSRRDVATLQETLRLVSKFDIEGTLPSLQHDFCCRWNDIIDIAGIVRYNCD